MQLRTSRELVVYKFSCKSWPDVFFLVHLNCFGGLLVWESKYLISIKTIRFRSKSRNNMISSLIVSLPQQRHKMSEPAKRRTRSSSPARPIRTTSTTTFPSGPDPSISRPGQPKLTPSASLVDNEFLSEPDTISLFENLHIEYTSSSHEPRSFPYSVKQQCWDKAEKVKGRAPDRWRRDPLGNIVFRKFVGCPGCLCHDYDHIVPYSKGGKSTLENCQVLQATVNRSKGNRTELSKADLIRRSSYCLVKDRDMDIIELSAYGNVHRTEEPQGCAIQ